MLRLDANDIITLRSPGGDKFAVFMNELIGAHARSVGIPASSVSTSIQTNVGDGGVDAEVSAHTERDSMGLMQTPTVWQFKSTAARSITTPKLTEEIEKNYSRDRVSAGAKYLFCITDNLTAEKKHDWEQNLAEVAARISPQSPTPAVLSADDIANWANSYPAIVIRYSRIRSSNFLAWDSWKTVVTRFTSTYVEPQNAQSIIKTLKDHSNLENTPADAVARIHGTSGVGKTRIAYEALKDMLGVEGHVIYTEDESAAIKLGYDLANEGRSGLLVVDNCSEPGSDRLSEILGGSFERVRVVSIHNHMAGEAPSYQGASWLAPMHERETEKVLEQNFQNVPSARIRAYSRLAGGSISFAISLARHDAELPPGGVPQHDSIVDGYFRYALSSEQQGIAAAMALVDAIGYKGSVASELTALAELTGFEESDLRSRALNMRTIPGIIGVAGRYLHVYPPALASRAFLSAWTRWGTFDPDAFLSQIASHPMLRARFLRRVAESAADDVRDRVSGYFLYRTGDLTPDILASKGGANELMTLVEVEPDAFLPLLSRVVADATEEQLAWGAAGSPIGTETYWRLVRLVEGLANMPEYFCWCEAILARLATLSPPTGYANDASGVYHKLFRPIYSGTQVPFGERLQLLDDRLISGDFGTVSLVVKTVEEMFAQSYFVAFGPSMVGGRVPGQDWAPSGQAELLSCLVQAFRVLERATKHQNHSIRQEAWEVVGNRMTQFALYQLSAKVEALLADSEPLDDQHHPVLSAAEAVIALHDRATYQEARITESEIQVQKRIVDRFKPTEGIARIRYELVRRPTLRTVAEQEARQGTLRTLATGFLEISQPLASEIGWLCAQTSFDAYQFGREVGRSDDEFKVFRSLLEAPPLYARSPFLRGYFDGLKAHHPAEDEISALLAEIELSSPLIALLFACRLIAPSKRLVELIRLLDQYEVPSLVLEEFVVVNDALFLQVDELVEAVERLRVAACSGHGDAVSIALELIHKRIEQDKKIPGSPHPLQDERLRAVTWQIIEAGFAIRVRDDYHWKDILIALCTIDPDHTINLLFQSLKSENRWQRQDALEMLVPLADQHPEQIVNGLGSLALDQLNSGHFSRQPLRVLIAAIPITYVERWQTSASSDELAALAYHLPVPQIADTGEPEIPPATRMMLEDTRAGDRALEQFCQGSVTWNLEDKNDDFGHMMSNDVYSALEWISGAEALRLAPSRQIQKWYEFLMNYLAPVKHLHERLNEDAKETGYHLS